MNKINLVSILLYILTDYCHGFDFGAEDFFSTETPTATGTGTAAPTEPDWDCMYWWELPADAMEQATNLGYDSQCWNNGCYLLAYTLTWDELTPEQQTAATFFGYTQGYWDSPDLWDGFTWDALLPEAQEQAAILGFNYDRWDNAGYVYTYFSFWDDLTVEQQLAAEFFKYNQTIWDEKTAWEDIPETIQQQLTTLGYGADLWSTEGDAAVDGLYWEELTWEQQYAAQSFGWSEETWNCCSEAPSSAPTE